MKSSPNFREKRSAPLVFYDFFVTFTPNGGEIIEDKGISTALVLGIVSAALGASLIGSIFYYQNRTGELKSDKQGLKENFQNLKYEYNSLEENHSELNDEFNYLVENYESLASQLESYEEWQHHIHYYRNSAENTYYWEYMPYSYAYYWKTRERPYPSEYYPMNIDLSQYINFDFEKSTISNWANYFDKTNFSKKEYAKEALKFVHNNIYYMKDEESTGNTEYWKYPTETLFDQVGDCEDTVFLLASLLRAKGIPCIILEYPNHVAVGIGIEDLTGRYYKYDGRKYYFAETTSNKFDEDQRREGNYEIGEFPSGLTAKPYVHDLSGTSISTANLTNIKMTEEIDEQQRPVKITDEFSPTIDRVYVTMEVSNVTSNTGITAKWYNLDKNTKMHSYTLIVETSTNVAFWLNKPSSGWSTGSYEVSLSLNGERVETVPFSITE